MKIRIITSCTGQKRYSPENQLTQTDFCHVHEPGEFDLLEERLSEFSTSAQDLYTGLQHVRLMEGVRRMREECGADSVDLWILSAGYGLIPANREIVPYECTFQGMKAREIDTWAQHLRVPEDVRQFFMRPADLVLVLLSDAYLRALALDKDVTFAAPTLFFTGKASQRRVKGQGILRIVSLTNREAKCFSCGLVGLKGEVARRILHHLIEEGETFRAKLFDLAEHILDTLLGGKC